MTKKAVALAAHGFKSPKASLEELSPGFARMARSGTERYAVEGRLLELETPCRVLGLL
jgi:hypothetical protein